MVRGPRPTEGGTRPESHIRVNWLDTNQSLPWFEVLRLNLGAAPVLALALQVLPQ